MQHSKVCLVPVSSHSSLDCLQCKSCLHSLCRWWCEYMMLVSHQVCTFLRHNAVSAVDRATVAHAPPQSAFYNDYLYHATRVAAEVLGSLKCDCAEQLKLAMEYIQEHDNGIIIYLQQEGRGIGLSNKIAAYSLQVGPLLAHALPLTCPSPLQQHSKPARSCLLMHDAVGHIVQQQSWCVLIVGWT